MSPILFGCSRALAAALAVTCILGAPPARAEYPERPVKIMLSFGAGGIADVTMRLVAGKLSERMGVQFVVENRPGAGGINSAMAAKSAAADGHTLLLNGNGSALSVSLFKSLPYDIMKDFSTISVMAQFDMLLATKTDGEFATVGRLVERARAQLGKLNFGTVAAGSTQNLSAEMFKVVTGIQAAVVTFRTSPDLVTALLRGDVDVGFDYLAAFASGLSDKKLKIIASGGEQRSSLTPDTPTVVESDGPNTS
jgi:tripartite-type tricarboxylate transporter receptor subunit TctC